MKQETYKVPTKDNTPPNMNIPSKTWQELKNVKYKVKNLDTIKTPQALTKNIYSSKLHKLQPKTYTPHERKTRQSTLSFCDGMPKGKQNLHYQKGGGLNYANSARKARISSSTSTKIYP